MFAKLLPAALIALIGSTSLAFAESVEGTIQSVDVEAMTLTLEDGMVVELPATFKDQAAELKAGEKVKVEWKQNGEQNEATSVTVEE